MMYLSEMGTMPGGIGVEDFALSTGMTIFSAVLSPVFVIIGLFIASAILHVLLMIFGGANNGFEASFRVIAYTSGATTLFQLLPLCGWFIAFIWSIAVQIRGAQEIHETDNWRAVLAVLLPLVLCCGCFIAGFGLLFAGLAASLGAQ